MNIDIERVDKFGEKLRDRLQTIGNEASWGAKFDLSRPAVSDYYRAPVMVGGVGIKKNWIQLNGHTYFHRSYCSPEPWKLQARFPSHPGSPLWEKKPPYVHGSQPQEWSLGGPDVWAVSYENLSKALSDQGEDDVLDETLGDLRISWSYANGQPLPQDSVDDGGSAGRVDITLSIDTAVWRQFQQVYAQRYKSRRKHPKRKSYAELQNEAIDEALTQYVAKYGVAG